MILVDSESLRKTVCDSKANNIVHIVSNSDSIYPYFRSVVVQIVSICDIFNYQNYTAVIPMTLISWIHRFVTTIEILFI